MNPVANSYQVPRATLACDLRLDGNEGPPPDAALWQCLLDGGAELLQRYPSASALQQRLAEEFSLPAERVLVTAGGDEALDRVCRALLRRGDRVLLPVPAFEMTERYLALAGAEVDRVRWIDAFPIDAMIETLRADTRMVVVTSPNNPTGAVLGAEDLQRLSRAAPHAVLVVDLAYTEFADQDLTPTALELPRCVVIRTFSKAWSLAGARVGYALGDPACLRRMAAAGGPYAVAGPSLALAEARLQSGGEAMRATVRRVREERERLTELCQRLGLRPRPSQANFVMLECADPTWLRDALAGFGIAVRVFPRRALLQQAVRTSCPAQEDSWQRLCTALTIVARPQALLFDLDGVLADVSRSYRSAIRATAAAFGVDVEDADVQAAKDAGAANDDWSLTWRLVMQRGVRCTLDQIREVFEGLYQGTDGVPGLHHHEQLLLPRAVLQRWAQRLPLGLVTGRPRADTTRFLRRFGLEDLFQAVVCREDAALKPDPEPVRLALQKLGCDRAWMVGDTPDDLVAARAAGVLPLAVAAPPLAVAATPLATRALGDAGAARVLDSLLDLDALLP